MALLGAGSGGTQPGHEEMSQKAQRGQYAASYVVPTGKRIKT